MFHSSKIIIKYIFSVCADYSWGDKCENFCGSCKDGAICNQVTGDCPNGCSDGWYGNRCDSSEF